MIISRRPVPELREVNLTLLGEEIIAFNAIDSESAGSITCRFWKLKVCTSTIASVDCLFWIL